MDIIFANDRLEKECSDRRLLERKHGVDRAKRIMQRLNALKFAEVLDDMRSLPGRCHELLHDRSGQLSLDLDHPYRLIFEPANDPIPLKEDGGLDWKNITAVNIIGIEDTHE